MPAPALSPVQQQELFTWFDQGCTISAALGRASAAGWTVKRTVIGEQHKAWKLLRQAGAGAPQAPAAALATIAPQAAYDRVLTALVHMVEDRRLEPRARADAARVVVGMVAAPEREKEEAAGGAPPPFRVESPN